DDAPHLSLVCLVRPENVEVLETGDGGEEAAPGRPEVEELLGVAVHVERSQPPESLDGLVGVAHTLLARAIRRGRGGVEEADAAADRPSSQLTGELEVVADEVARVPLRGRRTGAHVEHEVEIAERAGLEGGKEVFLL